MTPARLRLDDFESSISLIGGAGFIGTRIATLLREQSIPFRIADLRESCSFPEVSTQCDVRDIDSVRKAVHVGGSTIINLAAEHRDDVRPVSRYYETNVKGAQSVCVVAGERGIQNIIFTSSVAVYGFQPKPVDEGGPFAPFNEYGRTKLGAEQIYRAWADEDPSRSLVIVRPTVVFGEENRGNVYNLLRQIAAGKFLMVGSGANVKSMAYVGNVAAFLVHALTMGPGIHVFNYVDGPDLNTRELVEYIRHCIGASGRLRRIPKSVAMTGGHLLDLAARISGRTFPVSAVRVRKFCETTQVRAEHIAQTGFTPPYSLEEGLARTIRFEFSHGRAPHQNR